MQTTENKTIRERNNRQTKRNKRKPKVTNYLNSKINHLKKSYSVRRKRFAIITQIILLI